MERTAYARTMEEKKEIPKYGIKGFFFLLCTHFMKIVSLNLLFLLFSIPLVTIPASLTAMSRVIELLMRDGYTHLFQDFLKEWKRSFKKSLGLGLIYGGIMVLLSISSKFYPQFLIWPETGDIIFCACVALMFLVSVIFCYAFPMLAVMELSVADIIKNSARMMVGRLKNSFVLLLIVIALNGTAVYLFPQSLPVIFLLAFSVCQLAVCMAVRRPFEELLIEPAQKLKQQEIRLEK